MRRIAAGVFQGGCAPAGPALKWRLKILSVETVAAGTHYSESDSNGGKGFDFRNGVRVGTLDNATVYLYM